MNKIEFEKIAIEYIDVLYNRAIQLTYDTNLAEDLVQETFLNAFKSFYSFRKGTNIKAWLFKIMQNIFINSYRKKKREPEILELNDDLLEISLAKNQSEEHNFFSKLMDMEVQQALDSLPEEFRAAVVLSDLEDFSYKEISKIMKCPVGTVRSRIARARELLFEKLQAYAKSRGYI